MTVLLVLKPFSVILLTVGEGVNSLSLALALYVLAFIYVAVLKFGAAFP